MSEVNELRVIITSPAWSLSSSNTFKRAKHCLKYKCKKHFIFTAKPVSSGLIMRGAFTPSSIFTTCIHVDGETLSKCAAGHRLKRCYFLPPFFQKFLRNNFFLQQWIHSSAPDCDAKASLFTPSFAHNPQPPIFKAVLRVLNFLISCHWKSLKTPIMLTLSSNQVASKKKKNKIKQYLDFAVYSQY